MGSSASGAQLTSLATVSAVIDEPHCGSSDTEDDNKEESTTESVLPIAVPDCNHRFKFSARPPGCAVQRL
jgi:hypothetical protein